MLKSLPENLSSKEALKEAARLFDDALTATGLSDAKAAEAIGFSTKNRSKVFLMRSGKLPLTLSKVLMLLAHRPRAGRALLASLAAWSHTRTGGFVGSSITLLDELIREVLDLARYACVARADGKLDADECRELRRLLARVRSALDAFEGSITRATEARPS